MRVPGALIGAPGTIHAISIVSRARSHHHGACGPSDRRGNQSVNAHIWWVKGVGLLPSSAANNHDDAGNDHDGAKGSQRDDGDQ